MSEELRGDVLSHTLPDGTTTSAWNLDSAWFSLSPRINSPFIPWFPHWRPYQWLRTMSNKLIPSKKMLMGRRSPPHLTSNHPKNYPRVRSGRSSVRRTQIPAATCGHAFCLGCFGDFTIFMLTVNQAAWEGVQGKTHSHHLKQLPCHSMTISWESLYK